MAPDYDGAGCGKRRRTGAPVASGAGDAASAADAAAVATGVQVRTRTGTQTVGAAAQRVAPTTLAVPEGCTQPSRVAALLQVASLLLLPVATSAAKLAGTCARFRSAMTWMGITMAAVTAHAVAAYVVLRCAPPLDTPLPDGWNIVAPVTAAGDIDTLRRAARLGLEGMQAIASQLLDPIVSALLVAIGGRIKRLKTAKKPILYAEVKAAFDRAKAHPTPIRVRDAFALVLGFHFAMRASELLALLGRDIVLVDDNSAIQVRFPNVKNRQSVFSSHEPFVVTASGGLLLEAYTLFNTHVGFRDDLCVFHQLRGAAETPLSRDWLCGVIAAAAPERTPHSLRVGAATEMYAAGVGIPVIMAVGRWTSAAACLYVLGTMEDTMEATKAMGSGGLRLSSEGLRRATRASIPAAAIPRVDADAWAAACAAG